MKEQIALAETRSKTVKYNNGTNAFVPSQLKPLVGVPARWIYLTYVQLRYKSTCIATDRLQKVVATKRVSP